MDGVRNWVKKPRPRDQNDRRRNSASLTQDTVEGARKRARVMALEIARQSVGGTGKAIRTWAIARYYVDVRDVSSIILIAKITAASTAPTALRFLSSPLSFLLTSRNIHATIFSYVLSCCVIQMYLIENRTQRQRKFLLQQFRFETASFEKVRRGESALSLYVILARDQERTVDKLMSLLLYFCIFRAVIQNLF